MNIVSRITLALLSAAALTGTSISAAHLKTSVKTVQPGKQLHRKFQKLNDNLLEIKKCPTSRMPSAQEWEELKTRFPNGIERYTTIKNVDGHVTVESTNHLPQTRWSKFCATMRKSTKPIIATTALVVAAVTGYLCNKYYKAAFVDSY